MAVVGMARQPSVIMMTQAALSARMMKPMQHCVAFGKNIVIIQPLTNTTKWSRNIVIKRAITATVSFSSIYVLYN